MSAAVTSSMTWCALRPLIAANMLRIMGASLPLISRPPLMRGPAARFPYLRLSDDRRVDVREDVVLHVIAVDRRDDSPVADRHHERGAVHEDDRLARALAGGAIDAALKPRERACVDLDAAPADTLERVAG